LLALNAEANGLCKTGLDTSRWEGRLRQPELYGDQWLLAYEAPKGGWLKPSAGCGYVEDDEAFGYLSENGVHFYEPVEAAVKAPPELEVPVGETRLVTSEAGSQDALVSSLLQTPWGDYW